jgi:hypothetical protein
MTRSKIEDETSKFGVSLTSLISAKPGFKVTQPSDSEKRIRKSVSKMLTDSDLRRDSIDFRAHIIGAYHFVWNTDGNEL